MSIADPSLWKVGMESFLLCRPCDVSRTTAALSIWGNTPEM